MQELIILIMVAGTTISILFIVALVIVYQHKSNEAEEWMKDNTSDSYEEWLKENYGNHE